MLLKFWIFWPTSPLCQAPMLYVLVSQSLTPPPPPRPSLLAWRRLWKFCWKNAEKFSSKNIANKGKKIGNWLTEKPTASLTFISPFTFTLCPLAPLLFLLKILPGTGWFASEHFKNLRNVDGQIDRDRKVKDWWKSEAS